MKFIVTWLALSIGLTGAIQAAPPAAAFLLPAEAATGAVLTVQGITLNMGTDDVLVGPASVVKATLTIGGKTWPLTFEARAQQPQSISKNGFADTDYVLRLPENIRGLGIIDIDAQAARPSRLAIQLGDSIERKSVPSAQMATGDDSVLGRTFSGRLGPPEPIYLAYGFSGDRLRSIRAAATLIHDENTSCPTH